MLNSTRNVEENKMKFLDSVGGRKFIGFIVAVIAIVLMGKWYNLDAEKLIAGILGAYTILAAGNIITKKIYDGGKKK
jgi:hypothetical protein